MKTIKCGSCGHEIVFLKTKKGKFVPVNAETIQGKERNYDNKIGHISHFSSCPQAKDWRRK